MRVIMMRPPLHIVFTGGGTGGHLFPALAVATTLGREVSRLRITFAGSGKEFERRHVLAAKLEYLALRCRPVPRRLHQVLSFVSDNLAGYRTARRFLREQHVAAVVGLGGYASAPMARAATAEKIPLILLEQNVVPGKATRWMARRATLVCTAFEQTGRQLRRRCPWRVTGTPIRDGFARRRAAAWPENRLLVLGGSGGARSLNENVPRALYKVGSRLTGWWIVHQSGGRDLDATRRLYLKLGLRATVTDFLGDMPGELTAADLAVCRSGGTTLAELAAAGVPAVLLPYPYAAGDHQRKNAELYAAAGGSRLLGNREMAHRLDDHLASVLSELLDAPAQRAAMSSAMRRLARPHAAADVAALILEVIAGQPHRGAMPAAA